MKGDGGDKGRRRKGCILIEKVEGSAAEMVARSREREMESEECVCIGSVRGVFSHRDVFSPLISALVEHFCGKHPWIYLQESFDVLLLIL